ncbi:MAG: flagellar hook-basal body complex protein FliE [Lachnospiraceae bacterium]|nr:flagellar hook-basal body complex protein FliE [Lachnospiraceae bacterium]
MEFTSIGAISRAEDYTASWEKTKETTAEKNTAFETLFQSALQMLRETNDYTNAAREEELSYMMGLKNSTTDVMVAQTKANMSLQYTVAVRNAVLDAYKELMQLQF